MTASVMKAVSALLSLPLSFELRHNDVIRIGTEQFGVLLAPPCSGMDGFALFCALLAMNMLLDWQTFRRAHLTLLFLSGLGLIFLCNALRIMLLFGIGNLGALYENDFLQDTMFTMFHEHVGWLFYTLVYAAYAGFLYRSLSGSDR